MTTSAVNLQYIAAFNNLCETQPPFCAEPRPQLWEAVDPPHPSSTDTAIRIIRKELSGQGIRPIDMLGNCFKFVRISSFALMRERIRHTVTIGNVMINGKAVYKTSAASIAKDMEDGYDESTTAEAHAWITLQNGAVIDLTILSHLANREKRKPLKLITGIFGSDLPSGHQIHYFPYFLGPAYMLRVTTPPDPAAITLSHAWVLGIDKLLKEENVKA